MGLAPKQRDRLTTKIQVVCCFRACPTFTTDQRVRRGPRGKGTGTVPLPLPDISGLGGTEPVPFLARVFSLRPYEPHGRRDRYVHVRM